MLERFTILIISKSYRRIRTLQSAIMQVISASPLNLRSYIYIYIGPGHVAGRLARRSQTQTRARSSHAKVPGNVGTTHDIDRYVRSYLVRSPVYIKAAERTRTDVPAHSARPPARVRAYHT